MKACFKCGQVKDLSEFYKNKGMSDGHVNKCKSCNKKDVRENRSKNIDYYREYDSHRYSTVKVRAEERKEYIRRYRSDNPEKYGAHTILNNRVRTGEVKKPSNCPVCNDFTKSREMHAHHDDYSKPLDVRWMCVRCHAKEHPRSFSD